MRCSVQQKSRITGHPGEIFHLHQSLRSLVRVCCLIGKKAKKGAFHASPEDHPSMSAGSLSAEEYRDPVKVLRLAFKTCSPEAFEDFLSAAVYFSWADVRYEEEGRIIIPYLQLMKILDAAWLIAERASKEN